MKEVDVVFINGAPEIRNRREPAMPISGFHGFCGCGIRAEFVQPNGNLSCNKYSRCNLRLSGADALEKGNKALNRISRAIDRDSHPDDIITVVRNIIDGLS